MKVLHCVALLLVLASLAPYTLAHGDHFDEEIFDQSAINAFLQPIFRELQADHAIVKNLKRTTPETPIEKARCGTDDIFHTLPEGKAMAAYKKRSAEQPSEATPEKKENKRSTTTGYAAIRIGVDDSFITSNFARACYSTGQTISGYTCKAEDVLDSATKNLLTQYIIPAAVGIVEATLGVVPVQGNLLLDAGFYADTTTCGYANTPIPVSYVEGQGNGLANADYYAAFTAVPYTESGTSNVLASAGPCNAEMLGGGRFGRPLAGGVNIAPKYARSVDVKDYAAFRAYVMVIVHEFFHGLGFIDARLNGAFYSSPTPSSTQRSHTVTVLTTPHVKEFARNHFGCNTLNGVELEDGGGSGTQGSHWEQRLALNELMAGVQLWGVTLSNMTLALLQDSGWYATNFAMAEPFGWGYGRGCSWVNQDCDSGQWNAIGEFCQTANSVYKCTYDRKAVGECDLTTYTSNLPSYYQYFAQPTVGGSLETADFCPVIQSLQDTICQSISSTVYVEDTYGVDSRCFEVQYDGSADAGCYRHRCTSTTTVQAYVRGNWVDCPYGTTITVNGSPTLRLQCPSASENFCVTKLSPFAIAGTRRLDVPVYSFPPDVGSGAESGLIARVWIAVVFSVLTIALRL